MSALRAPRAGDPRRGQALAEAVLVLPILMLFVFGIIETSNAWRAFQVVTNAAREAARLAILPDADEVDIRERVVEQLAANGITLSDPDTQISFECEGDAGLCEATGQNTTVAVRYPYTFRLLRPVITLACGDACGGDFGTITIASTTIMRRE